jgi:hypothetical protein
MAVSLAPQRTLVTGTKTARYRNWISATRFMKLRLRYLDEMWHVYFTRVSEQLGFVKSIKQQPLPQPVSGHVKRTVSLGPQGTLVTTPKQSSLLWNQYQRRVWWTCVFNVSTNGPCCGAHRLVLVMGFYGAQCPLQIRRPPLQLPAACLPAASWNQPGFGSHQGLHPGSSHDMTKFTKIRSSIQIHRNPQSQASYVEIQRHHLTRKKCISQGGMQKYHKNIWTRRNAKIS